ncbi:hypothetical protein BH10ACI2_BH10ACI2_09950 [soil metagenome]
MNKKYAGKLLFLLVIVACIASNAFSQRQVPAAKVSKPAIFAVLMDGKSLEPIAYVNKGKLEAPANGSDEESVITAFNRIYYKPGTVYRLIFGSADAGTVTVKSANAKSDCSKNMADVLTKTSKTPLKGFVMGLATNVAGKTTGTGMRRKPTTAEKEEIDGLVRARFLKEKLTPKILRYQNLTALDLDNDGKAEFVGSYWVEIDKLTRGLLFFIAGQGSSGKYSFGYDEYRTVDQASVMSGDIKDVDGMVYHELLLDAFDYNGDGTAEVFTYQQSFEGAGFNVYRKSGDKWTQAYDFSNYHCGY